MTLDIQRKQQHEVIASILTLAWSNLTEEKGALAKSNLFTTYKDFLIRLEKFDAGTEEMDDRVI